MSHQLSTPFLPATFSHSPTTNPCSLIAQGAEALIYRTTFLTSSLPVAIKVRPPKPYRHPTLDARLTRHRILSEARILVKCRREGICVPGVVALDFDVEFEGNKGKGGWMAIEWIEGGSVRAVLDMWLKEKMTAAAVEEEEGLKDLMVKIGKAVGKLHRIGVVHGDLTTSNILLQPPSSSSTSGSGDNQGLNATIPHRDSTGTASSLQGKIILIDFGLAAGSMQDEDRAVDLYVLERAFASTHPRAEGLFKEVLRAYGESFKGGPAVLKRLEDVRQRGRKRSMVG